MELGQPIADQFSIDLQIIRSISTTKEVQGSLAPRSLQQLGQLLKFKNAPHGQRPGNLQKGREWLIKKGIDLQPLLTKIAKPQAVYAQQQPFTDNYFYIQLDEKNMEEYLQKSKEYATMNLIQSVMSKKTHRQKCISKILEEIEDQGENRLKITWERQRSPQRRQQYLSIVKTIVCKEKEYFQILRELVPALRNGMQDQQHLIWQVLNFQFESYHQNASENENMSNLARSSLGLVQKQFQRRLHGQDIEKYVTSKYLSRADGKCEYDKSGFWAKAWVYMSAGLKQQFVDLLTFQSKNWVELLNAYLSSEQALSEGKPRHANLRPRADVQDVFYDQIIFALNGESKYSCELMSQAQSLELVWVLLRTTGVYWSENKQKFMRIREGVVQGYKNGSSDPQIVRQMLYLLDFESVVALGPNAALNRDDYLHLLLALSAYPHLINTRSLEDRLVPRLVEFILELFVEKKEEYPYYVALIPSHRLITEASALIVSSDMAESFNWKCLSGLISDKLYDGLVRATFAQVVNLQGNYLRAAEKLQELLGRNDNSLDYLIQLLIRYYMQRHACSYEQMLKAEQLGLRLSRENDVDPKYQKVFLLFSSLRELLARLMTRDEVKLQQFIANKQLFFLDHWLRTIGAVVLQKLAQLNGVQVYFYYLRSAVKGAEICMGKSHRLGELKKFKWGILAVCEQILVMKSMIQWRNEPAVSSLLDYLHQSL